MDIINQEEQDAKVFVCTRVSLWACGERGQKCKKKKRERVEQNKTEQSETKKE